MLRAFISFPQEIIKWDLGLVNCREKDKQRNNKTMEDRKEAWWNDGIMEWWKRKSCELRVSG